MDAIDTVGTLHISFGLDHAENYGTTRDEYKLWVDYIFDRFGATLERRFRRYLLTAAFATGVWILGLLLAAPFGLAFIYVTTPGVYFFWIGIAWCFNALRWLSQTYHLRTNRVRPCFPVDDQKYKEFVSPYAHDATKNKEIFLRSIPIMLVTWAYFAAVTFAPGQVGTILTFAFPRAFPPIWHTGANLLPKMAILDFLSAVAIVHVYTGARLTLATAPLYGDMLKLPVVPIPNLVSELFQGVLSLYLTGAFMWSFGVILAELLYDARLDFLSVAFVITVVGFGLLAFILPRQAVHRIWRKSRDEAIGYVVNGYYASKPSDLPPEKLSELNDFIASAGAGKSPAFDTGQILNLVVGQLLPALPLILNTFAPRHLLG